MRQYTIKNVDEIVAESKGKRTNRELVKALIKKGPQLDSFWRPCWNGQGILGCFYSVFDCNRPRNFMMGVSTAVAKSNGRFALVLSSYPKNRRNADFCWIHLCSEFPCVASQELFQIPRKLRSIACSGDTVRRMNT
jgi:hypothetical protein